MHAAKEKSCIAKASRKRWRKGKPNKIGILATAPLGLDILLFFYFLTVFIILKYLKNSMFIWKFWKIYNSGLMIDIRFYFDRIKFENLEFYLYFSDYQNFVIDKIS